MFFSFKELAQLEAEMVQHDMDMLQRAGNIQPETKLETHMENASLKDTPVSTPNQSFAQEQENPTEYLTSASYPIQDYYQAPNTDEGNFQNNNMNDIQPKQTNEQMYQYPDNYVSEPNLNPPSSFCQPEIPSSHSCINSSGALYNTALTSSYQQNYNHSYTQSLNSSEDSALPEPLPRKKKSLPPFPTNMNDDFRYFEFINSY